MMDGDPAAPEARHSPSCTTEICDRTQSEKPAENNSTCSLALALAPPFPFGPAVLPGPCASRACSLACAPLVASEHMYEIEGRKSTERRNTQAPYFSVYLIEEVVALPN